MSRLGSHEYSGQEKVDGETYGPLGATKQRQNSSNKLHLACLIGRFNLLDTDPLSRLAHSVYPLVAVGRPLQSVSASAAGNCPLS